MYEPKDERYTAFGEEVCEQIIEKVSSGMSITEICKAPEMPNRQTVWRWVREGLGKDPDPKKLEFAEEFEAAQKVRARNLVDECQDIADDGSNDWIERTFGQETRMVVDTEALQRSKLRIDTRFRLAQFYNREDFSKEDNGGGTATVTRVVIDPSAFDPPEGWNRHAPKSVTSAQTSERSEPDAD